MTQGYIYVLANSAMPNVVKVGKTSRQPSLRAQELSGVTGVPTPFIVVYEKQFNDCDSAESFLHELLSIKGYRVSANREFFNAPVNEVIEAVLQAVAYDSNDFVDVEKDDSMFFSSSQNHELDELVLDEESIQPVWFDIWSQAEEYYYGLGDTLQDCNEAMRLYKQSIKLGCFLSYSKIAAMYECGLGVPESIRKAFDWCKEGVKNNNYICYLLMARLFIKELNLNNRNKSLQLFCKARNENFNVFLENENFIWREVVNFLIFLSDGTSLPSEFVDFLSEHRDEIGEILDSRVEEDADCYVPTRNLFYKIVS